LAEAERYQDSDLWPMSCLLFIVILPSHALGTYLTLGQK